jgi:hypothetical protein
MKFLNLLGFEPRSIGRPTYSLTGIMKECNFITLFFRTNIFILDEVNGFFSIYLILRAALGSEVHSAPNGNEYQKQNNYVSGE